MLPTSYIVLIILAIIYIPIYIWVWRSPNAIKYGLVKYGPLVMIKTQAGTKLMDRLCIYTKLWRFLGLISLGISVLFMLSIILILGIGLLNLATSIAAEGIGIEYALALPGINPILPLSYGILGLVVAVATHELAHGIQAKANGMRVKSTGLLYGVVPLGAFVEPNEEDVEKATRRQKLDMYSAGIATNFVIGVVTFIILAGLMTGFVSSPYGDNAAVHSITVDSPAYEEGINNGSLILTFDGVEYDYENFDYANYLYPGEIVTLGYQTEEGFQSADVRWGLFIESIVAGSPADGKLDSKTFITHITFSDGKRVPIYMYNSFIGYMNETVPGETLTLTCLSKDGLSTEDKDIVLGSKGSTGYIGISTSLSGMQFTTPDYILNDAKNPLYGAETISEGVVSLLSYLSGPMRGFDPIPDSIQWWYDVPLGDIFWIIITALFWIFWFSILLGISNTIPAYPFDGGFILLGGIDKILEKIGYKDSIKREETAKSITGSVSTIVIFLYIIVIFAVIF